MNHFIDYVMERIRTEYSVETIEYIGVAGWKYEQDKLVSMDIRVVKDYGTSKLWYIYKLKW